MLRVIQDIFKGILTPKVWSKNKNLKKLRETIADALWSGAETGYVEGYGKPIAEIAYNSPDAVMLSKLKDNVYTFAAAKNYKLVQQTAQLLTDGERVRPFGEFKKEALKIHKTYNQQWLEAEYNTTVASAQAAARWIRFEADKDLFPNLRFKTQGDANVRKAHEALNNIVRPTNDDFWLTHYPPIAFQCRCYVVQETADVAISPKEKLKDIPEPDSRFSGNVGITGQIFGEKHPYFQNVPKEVKQEIKNPKSDA